MGRLSQGFQLVGIILVSLILLALFPPSKLATYRWRLSNRYIAFSRVYLSSRSGIIDTADGVFFISPEEISCVELSPYGVSIETLDGCIYADTMDDWDGSTVDEAKQSAVHALLTQFHAGKDSRKVFDAYAKPLKQLKFRYFCGVLLPLCFVAGLLFLFLSDAMHPALFKSIVIGVGGILVVDYRRRSRSLTKQLANKSVDST